MDANYQIDSDDSLSDAVARVAERIAAQHRENVEVEKITLALKHNLDPATHTILILENQPDGDFLCIVPNKELATMEGRKPDREALAARHPSALVPFPKGRSPLREAYARWREANP